MGVSYTLLYRGPLSGCNYQCHYCPFAARTDTPALLQEDKQALRRFCDWVSSRQEELAVFFVPRGEALSHSWYQEAIVSLSHLPHIRKVAIQTNLSGDIAWVARCRDDRLGLWCSYHPSQADASTFQGQCSQLDTIGISFSVGMVGVHEHFAEISEMRAALPAHVYLWVNAYKHEEPYYSEEDVRFLSAIDPLFTYNLSRYPSLGEACACGDTVCFIDGAGTIRRCPFTAKAIGNIFAGDFPTALHCQICSNAECHCYIGYVHMKRLGLGDVFGAGILERVPKTRIHTAGLLPPLD
ncbi:MAG: STM4011 family radical SAM protein [Armatimonadota bacterium]